MLFNGRKQAKKVAEFKREPVREATKAYDREATDVQLKIIRTHMAAQASEMSNLRHGVLEELGKIADLTTEVHRYLRALGPALRRIEEGLTCGHAPDGGNHPVVPQ